MSDVPSTPEAQENPTPVAPRRLSEELREILATAHADFRIGDLLKGVDKRSFGLLMLLFSFPIAIPATPPGFAIPFGLVVMALAAQLLAGRRIPWLPRRIMNGRIRGRTGRFFEAVPRFVARLEKLTKPRALWVYEHPNSRRFVGITGLLAGIAMLVPIPGVTSLAAFGVSLIGLGMIEEDGGIGAAGLVASSIAVLLTAAAVVLVVLYGPEGVEMIANWARLKF
ncbi:MAG: exopolysaccharide biosynthesis protein [Fimbriimonadaceae bacterium]